jgi:type IV pilus assembly protein PilQ
MEVHPEDSDGQVKANGLPSKSTTEVTSNIMVKDGHTIVIGGLFRESTIAGRSQVPFLGNLPWAGVLFRNQHDRTVREEVIILLTPHVVKDDAAYSKLSEEELKRCEDLRVGNRKGLMPWGRERLAQGWYESARKEMNKEHPNRAMAKFDLDCATNLVPTFGDAIGLKEEISGHAVADSDGSAIRQFVRRAMIMDVAPTTMPVTQAPATQPAHTQTAKATTQPSGATAKKSEDHDFDPSEAEKPAAAMPETAEASTEDDSAAIPQSTKKPEETPATSQPSGDATKPDYLPGDSSESVDVVNTQAAAPATQPAATTQPYNPVTVVTPLEETDEAATAPTATETPNAAPATAPAAQTDSSTSNVTVVPLDEEPADSK